MAGTKNTIDIEILTHLTNAAAVVSGVERIGFSLQDADESARQLAATMQSFFANLGLPTQNINSLAELQNLFRDIGVSIRQNGQFMTFTAQGINGITNSIRVAAEAEDRFSMVSESSSQRRLGTVQQLQQHYQNFINAQKEVYTLEEQGKQNSDLYQVKSDKLVEYMGQLSQYLDILKQSFETDEQGVFITYESATAEQQELAQIQRKYEWMLREVDARHQLAMADKETISQLKLIEAAERKRNAERREDEATVRQYISALQQAFSQEEHLQQLRSSGATQQEIAAQEELISYTQEYVNDLLREVEGTEAYKNAEAQLILMLEQHQVKMEQIAASKAHQIQEKNVKKYI